MENNVVNRETETMSCPCSKCGNGTAVVVATAEELGNDLTREALQKFAICPECEQRQRIEAEKKKRANIEAQRRFDAEQTYKSRLKASKLEKYFIGYEPDHPKANPELFAGMQAASNGNIFVAGKTGTCKTRILQRLAWGKVVEGLTVRYSPTTDLLDEINDAFRRETAGRALMKELYAVDLLVLDDLGKEAATAAKLQRLWQLIDRRYTRTEQEKNIASGKWNPLFCDRRDGWQIWISTNCDTVDVVNKFDQFSNKAGLPLLRRIENCCEVIKGGPLD